jgi:hypothetical protein
MGLFGFAREWPFIGMGLFVDALGSALAGPGTPVTFTLT